MSRLFTEGRVLGASGDVLGNWGVDLQIVPSDSAGSVVDHLMINRPRGVQGVSVGELQY